MPFEPPPTLPPFLDAHLPLTRRAWRLEHGIDAGRSLHFLDTGSPSGPESAQPVLLMHGNPTWSFLWRKVIAELQTSAADRALRCVAPDLLGLGFSDRLPRLEDHSVARHATAIAELVEALDLRDLILVGQDWGGPIVCAVGARLPERISGLVLGNTSVLVPKRPRGTVFHRFARMPLVSDVTFRALGFPQNVLHRLQGDPRSIHGEVARAYKLPLSGWGNRVAPLALARMVPSSPDHPSLPELRRGMEWATAFEGPVALVWGLRDPILGKVLGRHQKALPRASVRRCDGAGHFLQEEVPEEIAAAVREVASSH